MKRLLRYQSGCLMAGLFGLAAAASPAAAQPSAQVAALTKTEVVAQMPAAQVAGRDTLRRLYGGLKFGLSVSCFTGQTCYGPAKWEPGALVGLLLLRPVSAYAGWQVEALFSQKGARQNNYAYVYQDPTFVSSANTYWATLAYLDVPVLAAIGPGAGTGRQGLFAVAGPQVSVALEKREFVRPTDEAPGSVHEETISTDVHALAPVTAGYVVGAGYRWAKFKDACVSVELRYSTDFTRAYRDGYGAGSLCPGGRSPITNQVVQLQVSALFGKTRRSSQATPPPATTPPPTPQPRSMPPPRPTLPPPPRPTLPAPPRPTLPPRPPRDPEHPGGTPRNHPAETPRQDVPATPQPRQDVPATPAPAPVPTSDPLPRQSAPPVPQP